MKMIVGLGNPGQKYVGTRHNVGFEVLGQIAKKHFAPPPKSKFQSEVSEIRIGNEKILLLCPLTFMNLSGQGVSQASSFYQIEPAEILVVCDDFNLGLDRLRFRPAGTSGGQNGLKDIIKRLGTQDFPRLRVGIGPVPERWDPADFVLGKYSEEELARTNAVVDRCVKASEDWVKNGVGYCMNLYNSDPNKKKITKPKTTNSPSEKELLGDHSEGSRNSSETGDH